MCRVQRVSFAKAYISQRMPMLQPCGPWWLCPFLKTVGESAQGTPFLKDAGN